MNYKTSMRMYMNPRRWLVLAIGVLGFSVFCSACSVIYTHFSQGRFGRSPELYFQAALDSTVLSFALAVPVLTWLGIKMYEMRCINQMLARMASTDILTDCLNRRALLDFVNAYLEQACKCASSRGEGCKCAAPEGGMPHGGALLVLDVDHFKSINDILGHVGGDAALKHIAMVTKTAVRQCDVVARIGGEEFAVFLPGISGVDAARIAQRIVETVHETPFAVNGKVVSLAVSIGGALFDRPVPFARLYRTADANLYSAKQNGRNQAIMPPLAA